MKEKIIELIENKKGRYKAEELADEILELFEEFLFSDEFDVKLNAQELNMKAVRCDCRHCQPEKWKEDNRSIWINISP